MISARGFTLVELLVALAITGILGVVAFVNLENFSKDQALNKGVTQTQTLLRLAQSNATSGLTCGDTAAVSWLVKFDTNKKLLSLSCQNSATELVKQTLTLDNNIEVSGISTGISCLSSAFPAQPLTVIFSVPFGNISFVLARGVGPNECVVGNPLISVTLANTKTSLTKIINVSKGGSIDAQ